MAKENLIHVSPEKIPRAYFETRNYYHLPAGITRFVDVLVTYSGDAKL